MFRQLLNFLFSLSFLLLIYSPGVNGATDRLVPFEKAGLILFLSVLLLKIYIGGIKTVNNMGHLFFTGLVLLLMSFSLSTGAVFLFALLGAFTFINDSIRDELIVAYKRVILIIVLAFYYITITGDAFGVSTSIFDRRFSGIVQTSTLYGVLVGVALLFRAVRGSKKSIYNVVYEMLSVVSILLSGSRTAILVVTVFLFYRYFWTIVVVLSSSIFFINLSYIKDRVYFIRRLFESDDYVSLGGRSTKFIPVINDFIVMPVNKVLFGMGFGNFSDLGSQYTAHSNVLRIIVEFGFFGFLLYVIMMFVLAINGFRSRDIVLLILLALDLTLANMLSLNVLFIVTLIYVSREKRSFINSI